MGLEEGNELGATARVKACASHEAEDEGLVIVTFQRCMAVPWGRTWDGHSFCQLQPNGGAEEEAERKQLVLSTASVSGPSRLRSLHSQLVLSLSKACLCLTVPPQVGYHRMNTCAKKICRLACRIWHPPSNQSGSR